MEYPLVSIITVNFDHPEVTCEMLESLRHISYPNIEVIVVDNASPRDNPDVIKERFPEIIFIKSAVNLGFAGGNNLGIRQAKGKYVLFINNDTEVEPDFLEPLVAKCESDPQIGGVSPKIRFFHTPNTLQYTGQAPINNYTIRSHGYGHGAIDTCQFDKDTLTYFVHGAAMLIPMQVIQEVGMMAEIYFLYYEELDWGARIRKAGYQLWYVHNSLIMHKESISTGKATPFKTYYMNRSRIIYLRRNTFGPVFIVAFLFQVFISIPKNLLFYLIKGQMDHFKSYVNAILWHIHHNSAKDVSSNPILK